MIEEGRHWEAQATENYQLKPNAEHEFMISKADLESAREIIRDLRQQIEASSSMAEESEKQRASSVQELDEVLKVVKSIRSSLRQ
jgi:hypothetical protein